MKAPYDLMCRLYLKQAVSPQKALEALNLGGLEVEGYEKGALLTSPTTNRGDLLSLRGLAREMGALALGTFEDPTPSLQGLANQQGNGGLGIDLQDAACPLYIGVVIEKVQVEESPDWLKDALEVGGMRPINVVVDLTNYVNLCLGQPMHAFDADRVKDRKIIVRKARDGEKIELIDHKERELTNSQLVIADADKALALAGVMGGAGSEVSEASQNILLESAWFDPATIRKQAVAHGLRTDASTRFEKTVDGGGVAAGVALFLSELKKLQPEVRIHEPLQVGAHDEKREWVPIKVANIGRLLGIEVEAEKVRQHLVALGFVLESAPEGWMARAPGWRHDIELEADLIEEVARLEGLDKIADVLPVQTMSRGGLPVLRKFERDLGNLLVGMGLRQCITYSLVSEEQAGLSMDPHWPVTAISNPMSKDHAFLRRSLLPSLLAVAGHNQGRKRGEVAIFEFGKTYRGKVPGVQEEKTLGILLCGEDGKRLRPSAEKPGDFFALKGLVERLLATLGVSDLLFTQVDVKPLSPLRSARIQSKGQMLGYIGEVHPLVLRQADIQGPVAYAELVLENLHRSLPGKPIEMGRISVLPGAARDLAVLVDAPISVQALLVEARVAAGKSLKEVRVFDVYRGDNIETGKKSVAMRFEFQAGEQSLKDSDIEAAMEKVQAYLKERFGAIRR